MALERLNEGELVELDEERKAAMVSNLLVVLCGNHDAQTNCQHRKSLLKMAEAKKSRFPFDSQQSYTLHSHHGQKTTFVQSMGKSNISSQSVSSNGRKTENTYQKPLTNHLRLIFNTFSCLPRSDRRIFPSFFFSSNFTLQKVLIS